MFNLKRSLVITESEKVTKVKKKKQFLCASVASGSSTSHPLAKEMRKG